MIESELLLPPLSVEAKMRREREFRTNGDGHISRLTVAAFQESQPEILEDDERVFGGDPLRRFVPIEDVPDDVPTPWCKGNWDKNARPR